MSSFTTRYVYTKTSSFPIRYPLQPPTQPFDPFIHSSTQQYYSSNMEDEEAKQKREAAIALRKARRCKSTSAMPVKTTLKGGLFLSDMKGADEVFGLENRYKAYAADRRKVLKKGDPLSNSIHESSPSKTPAAKEDPLSAKTCHGFFEYHKKVKANPMPSTASNTTTTRRKAPLRAKSLDMNDKALLARAMVSIKRNDDSSESSCNSSSSDDSSFTASLCSYSKEMAAQTDCFPTRPYVRGGKRPTTESGEIMSMQIDLLAPSAVQARPQDDTDNLDDDDLDGSSHPVAAANEESKRNTNNNNSDISSSSSSNSDSSDCRPRRKKDLKKTTTTTRKVPTRSKSLDMDSRAQLVRAATRIVATSSDHPKSRSSSKKTSCSKPKKELDDSKRSNTDKTTATSSSSRSKKSKSKESTNDSTTKLDKKKSFSSKSQTDTSDEKKKKSTKRSSVKPVQ
eukprot:scaffold28921_cov191-Amphora_coffeaeformis.AAC.11